MAAKKIDSTTLSVFMDRLLELCPGNTCEKSPCKPSPERDYLAQRRKSAKKTRPGSIQFWVPFGASERQRVVGTSRALEPAAQLFLVSQITSDQCITARSWAA